MRKIIIIIISLCFLILGFLFIDEISNKMSEKNIIDDGELTFSYTEIQSLNMPASDFKVITTLDELRNIVEGHNFNTKHSYIYIKFQGDNKHKYQIKHAIKSNNTITCVLTKTEVPENINLETIELTKEYIIDVTGVLDKELNVIVTNEDQVTNMPSE